MRRYHAAGSNNPLSLCSKHSCVFEFGLIICSKVNDIINMEASMLRKSVLSSHLRNSCLPLGTSFTGKPGALQRRAINQRSINSFRRGPVAVIDVDAVKISKRPSSIPSVSSSVGIDENKPVEGFFAQLVRTAAKTVAVVAIAGALVSRSF